VFSHVSSNIRISPTSTPKLKAPNNSAVKIQYVLRFVLGPMGAALLAARKQPPALFGIFGEAPRPQSVNVAPAR
jgi:hypothetical protein